MNVHPDYGMLADFETFVGAAHERKMQVMIELVINHTSDQHPWFQRARLAPAGSNEREFYVWSDTDKKYPQARIIFTDTEKSNWTWDPVANAYYWHRFFSHQPDLNFDNPLVLEEVQKAMRYWLDLGVDGLRLDAIPYLVERDGTNCENLAETHTIIKEIRRGMDERHQPHDSSRSESVAERRARLFRRRRRMPHGVSFPAHAAHLYGPAFGGPLTRYRYHCPNAADSRKLPVGIISAQSR
jgi:maltose alpha-D-glucosyltransferase/alpha-amylase